VKWFNDKKGYVKKCGHFFIEDCKIILWDMVQNYPAELLRTDTMQGTWKLQ